MKKFAILCSIMLLFSTLLGKEVVVEGFGAVVKGNKSLAKKEAVDDALRRALEKELGARISAETVVENYQLVSDKIISKVKGYVKSYKVLSEKESGGVITVKVKVIVKEKSLKNDIEMIQTTLERMNYPKIVIMMAEQNVNASTFSYWWSGGGAGASTIGSAEMAISSALLEKNFKIVDRNALLNKVRVKPSQKTVDVSNQQVLEMTKKLDADIVITGKALAKRGMNVANSNMISVQANVNMRAINLKNGRVIGSAYGNAARVNIDPMTAGSQAIELATKKASKKLINDMVKVWTQQLNNGQEIKLVVKNVTDSAELYKIEKKVNTVKQVTAVFMEKFEGNSGSFRIMFRGDANAFAQKLRGIALKPVKISSKEIVVKPQ